MMDIVEALAIVVVLVAALYAPSTVVALLRKKTCTPRR
jgi:hypothetical protein